MASSDDTSETSSDELQHAVLEAVQMLPDPQRIVTTLFYIEAYSHQEIASFLEVPKHTIDNRLRAARKHLKERMMDMVKETLHDNAPSKDDSFVNIIGLCNASAAGDADRVRQILDAAPSLISEQNPDTGRTPLQHAVMGHHTKAIELLIDAGADPLRGIYPMREITSPLTMAEDRGYQDIVDLIHTALYKEDTTPRGDTFCQAIRDGKMDTVYAMMEETPEIVKETDIQGNTGLHAAAYNRRWRLVTDLLDRGAKVERRNNKGDRPIEEVLMQDHPMALMIAGILLDRGAEYDILSACALNDPTAVRTMLEEDPALANFNPRQDPRSVFFPLVIAAKKGYKEIVELLLQHDADLDAGHPLLHAIDNENNEIAHLLLDHGARADMDSYPAMFRISDVVIFRGNQALIDRVIINGGRPHIYTYVKEKNYLVLSELLKPSRGWANSPELEPGFDRNRDLVLEWAIYFGNTDLVKMCLDLRPEYNQIEWFSLIWELTRNEAGPASQRTEVLQLILDYGVDPNVWSKNDVTLLHLHGCSETGQDKGDIQIALAGVLLDYGADINALDGNLQSSPLAWRCLYGHKAVAEYLLDRGADPNTAGAPWATPLAWAERKGWTDIADMLKQHGATG